MEDKEIIKALECCLLSNDHQCEDCEKCPLYETNDTVCQNLLAYHALDLIKRQKAEIAYWMDEAANAKKEAVKEFAERLKKELIAGGIYPVLVKNSIDKLLQEMPGGQND